MTKTREPRFNHAYIPGAQVWLPWEERELLESHADAGTCTSA